MRTPEQIADAINQINQICKDNDIQSVFVGTVKANDDIHLICYPGHDTATDSGINEVAVQLFHAAFRTPKSHLGTIILNVAAAMCISSPVIENTFYADLEIKRNMKS